VILLIVTTGKVGAGGSVVRLLGIEYVVPVAFTAATIREYVLLANKPVKVAVRPTRAFSVEGTILCPLILYVYEAAPAAPVQLAVNDESLIEDTVTTGIVGGGPIVCTLIADELIEPVPFVATTTTAYVVDAVNPVNVTALLRRAEFMLGVTELPFSV
jgi:hypothetical protein